MSSDQANEIIQVLSLLAEKLGSIDEHIAALRAAATSSTTTSEAVTPAPGA